MDKTDKPVVSSFKTKNKRDELIKYSILSLSSVVILLIIVSLIISHFHKNQPVTALEVCTTQTNNHLLYFSARDIEDNNITDLQKNVVDIEGLNGFKQDPNCLYPIIYYSINISDAIDANKYFEYLQSLNKPNLHYSNILGNTISYTALKTDVVNLNKFSTNNQKNDSSAHVPAGIGGNSQ